MRDEREIDFEKFLKETTLVSYIKVRRYRLFTIASIRLSCTHNFKVIFLGGGTLVA